MHQFVGRHPVVGEVGRSSVLADVDARESVESAFVGPCGAAEDPTAVGYGHDQHARAAYGEPAVVGHNGGCGRVDVLEDGFRGQVKRALGEVDLQDSFAEMHRMRRSNIDIRPWRPVRAVLRRSDPQQGEQNRKNKSKRHAAPYAGEVRSDMSI